MSRSASANGLLASLTPSTLESITAKLEGVPLPVGTPLAHAGRKPKYVYFLTSGIASVVVDMATGSAVEVGLFGHEALPGSLRLLGNQESSTRCFMQVGGTGLRIAFSQLEEEFRNNQEFRTRVLQYVQYETLTLRQIAACNRLHGVEERLARLLLMMSDRIDSDVLPLTQEFLGQMLGTRRASVTVSAGALQRAGLIEYHRGHVRILDRPSLEDAACECYAAVRRFYRDLYVASPL